MILPNHCFYSVIFQWLRFHLNCQAPLSSFLRTDHEVFVQRLVLWPQIRTAHTLYQLSTSQGHCQPWYLAWLCPDQHPTLQIGPISCTGSHDFLCSEEMYFFIRSLWKALLYPEQDCKMEAYLWRNKATILLQARLSLCLTSQHSKPKNFLTLPRAVFNISTQCIRTIQKAQIKFFCMNYDYYKNHPKKYFKSDCIHTLKRVYT